MSYYDDPMTDRAVNALSREQGRGEGAPMQPNRRDCYRDGNIVRVGADKDGNPWARYRVSVRNGRERIRRLRD